MSRSVLLIDSDKAFERLLVDELASLELTVKQLAPGQDALTHIESIAPVAIVIAVEEPDKAGFLLCNRAKKGAAAAIPVVMATKSVAESDFAAHRKLKVHADEYIDKRTLAPGALTASFRALLDGAAAEADFPDEFDIVEELTAGPALSSSAPDDVGVVEEAEMIVESGEFEAVDDFDQIIHEHHTKSAQDTSLRDEDAAFAALGDFPSFDEPPAAVDKSTQLAEISTAVAPSATLLSKLDGGDDAPDENEFSEDVATNFETANVVAAMDPTDSLAIPTSEVARITTAARPATVPPPFRPATIPPPIRRPTAPPSALFGNEQAFDGSAAALEIEAIPEPVPSPNRTLDSGRFDLGLDEVAAWANEEKSQISDRKAFSRITDLEKENERLLAELDRARQEAAERNGESARVYLRDQSQEHLLRIAQLEEELKQAKESIASYEASRMTKDQTIADLTAKRATADAAVSDAASRLSASQQRVGELTTEVEQAKAQAEKAKTQAEQTSAELAELTNKAAAQAKRVAELEEKIAGDATRADAAIALERERSLSAAREEFQAALAASSEDRDKALESAQAELAASQQTLGSVRAELDAVGVERTNAQARVSALEAELATATARAETLQAELASAQQNLQQHAAAPALANGSVDEAKLLRAKKAVAIALTILDER